MGGEEKRREKEMTKWLVIRRENESPFQAFRLKFKQRW